MERAVSHPSSGLNRHMHMTLSGSSQSSLSSGWKFGSLRCKENRQTTKPRLGEHGGDHRRRGTAAKHLRPKLRQWWSSSSAELLRFVCFMEVEVRAAGVAYSVRCCRMSFGVSVTSSTSFGVLPFSPVASGAPCVLRHRKARDNRRKGGEIWRQVFSHR